MVPIDQRVVFQMSVLNLFISTVSVVSLPLTCQPKPLSTKALPLQINCINFNFVGPTCQNYVGGYLTLYTSSNDLQMNSQPNTTLYSFPLAPYSTYINPQDTTFCPMEYFNLKQNEFDPKYLNSETTTTTLQISVQMQIVKIFGIDEVPSTLSAAVSITLEWTDSRLAWNESLAPFSYNPEHCTGINMQYFNANTVKLASAFLWYPDLVLVNSASDAANFVQNMVGYDRMIVAPNGRVTWKLFGNVLTYCKLKLTWYPFDIQTCSFQLSSRGSNIVNGVNFTTGKRPTLSNPHPIDDPVLSPEDFHESLSWTTQEATVTRVEKMVTGNSFTSTQSIIVYSITLQRNIKNIVTTTIIPLVLITVLSITSLWLEDIGTRLGLLVTALLTMVAILVSIIENFTQKLFY